VKLNTMKFTRVTWSSYTRWAERRIF